MPSDASRDIPALCARLAIDYARATDRGDGAAAASCFTDDGHLEMPGGRHLDGRAAIARRIAEQPPAQVSVHVLSNIAVTIDSPTRASGALLVTMYRGTRADEAGPLPLDGPYLVGEYQDVYRLTDEGWRIERRRLRTIFRRTDR